VGVSLGKANYCLKALIEKDQVKATNLNNSVNKRAYLYLFTTEGIEARALISVRFPQRITKKYETPHADIEQLLNELKSNRTESGPWNLSKHSRENLLC